MIDSVEASQINQPDVIAEVSAAFAAYEAALLRHDVAALNAFFWDSPQTVRYGVGETGIGIAAIRAYRETAKPVHPQRQLHNTVIVSFGRDSASIATEFTAPDSPLRGRQSQTWVRIGGQWRIVAAHVSQIDAAT